MLFFCLFLYETMVKDIIPENEFDLRIYYG